MYNKANMKTKSKLALIPIFITAVSLSSCSFWDIFGTRLKSIDISDISKAYILGDVFDDKNQLSITGTYSNGETKTLAYSEVTVNLSYENPGETITVDSNKPFTVANEYQLTVSVNNVTSNTLTINVLEHHIYASSIALNGATAMNAWSEVELTTTVNPINYTAPISYRASNSNLVELTPTERGVKVYGVSGGEVDIIARIASSESTYIEATHHLTISSSINVTTMSQNYKDYTEENYYRISSCPTSGDVKLLVIPVWLSDSAKYMSIYKKDEVREDITKAYFGSEKETGWHSVSSFYRYESGGLLNLSGTVSDWYSSSLSAKEVGAYNTKETCAIIKEATNWYFANNPTDSRSNYDFDGDGYLDGVILIYAAPDYSASSYLSEYNNLWAYCFWIQEAANFENPVPNVFFWASYDFMYGKETAFARTGNSYSNGDTSRCSVDAHTYIHEMGHVFGLDDYYDYGGYKYRPCGGFSMQDSNVGGHDPFSLLAFGWANAYIPTSTIDIKLRNFDTSHQVILLTPEWNSYNSPFDEYLLLEFYTNDGVNKFDTEQAYCGSYPQGPQTKAGGIRLWHVDSRLIRLNDSTVRFYNNCQVGRVTLAFTNTYYKNESDIDYVTPLFNVDSKYADFNLLQLIRNDHFATYRPTGNIYTSDLFYDNDTFDMYAFSSQFVNGHYLNSGKSLGFSFKVKEISTDSSGEKYATISIIKG